MSSRTLSEDQPSPWQMRFEDERVRWVLEEFGLLGHLRPLNEDCHARETRRRLTFQSFHALFPTFPVLLSARCRGRVAEGCPPARMFRRFDDVFLMQYYLEAYDRSHEEARGRPVGLVVPFDGYRGGMVVHDGDFGTRSTKMTHPVPDDVPPHRVTVESFPALVRHLARGGWTPRSPLPESPPANGPELTKEMPVTPWMVRKLGTNASLIVLGWLRKTLLSESGYDRLLVRRLADGERCVKATQEEIASETGLSARQVKRGLEDLRSEGLVAPVGSTGRSGLLLTRDALAGGEEP